MTRDESLSDAGDRTIPGEDNSASMTGSLLGAPTGPPGVSATGPPCSSQAQHPLACRRARANRKPGEREPKKQGCPPSSETEEADHAPKPSKLLPGHTNQRKIFFKKTNETPNGEQLLEEEEGPKRPIWGP